MNACPTPWKVPYRSEPSARAAHRMVVVALRKRGKDTHGLITYHCRCQDWHVGNVDTFATRAQRRLRRAIHEGKRAA